MSAGECADVTALPALRATHLQVELRAPPCLCESPCALPSPGVSGAEWMARAPEPGHQKRLSGECGMLDDISPPPTPPDSIHPSTVDGATTHNQLD